MKSKASHSQGMLLFQLSSTQIFAIGTLKIKEIVPYTNLTAFPQSHPEVLGAANIRGNTIPVIDMAAAVGYKPLSKEEMSSCYIITTDCQRKEIGFMVRGIEKIIECNWRDIEPPPESIGENTFLTGVTHIDDKLVQLIDIELILSNLFPGEASSTQATLTDIQREHLQPLNILLVDDSMVARKQLANALDEMHIPYQVTANGRDALNIMIAAAQAQQPIDILVSDIEMPGLDGYELAFEVRNRPDTAHAYIILHTSLSSEISVRQAHQVGANEALTKFDANELIQAMLRGAQYTNSDVAIS